MAHNTKKSKDHTRRSSQDGIPRRSGWSFLAPGIRTLLAIIAATAFLFTATTGFAQSLATDKLNYVPGETVTITGQGWQPQEAISMVIGNVAGTRPAIEIEVVAASDGSFRDTSFVVQPIDLDQMLTLTARGSSGAEAMIAFKDGVAPGSLKCSSLTPYNQTHYGLTAGQTVTCTIEGATDLSPAQQAGTDPVQVIVKSSKFGNLPASGAPSPFPGPRPATPAAPPSSVTAP